MPRKYTKVQVVGGIAAFFIPPVSVWMVEGCDIDFWICVVLTAIGFLPGSIYSCYIWSVWVERKWQTHHGREVTKHPFMIFSKEFERRSRWAGNGQNGLFGYFDDNIKGGNGLPNTVGGEIDLEKAQNLPTRKQKKAMKKARKEEEAQIARDEQLAQIMQNNTEQSQNAAAA